MVMEIGLHNTEKNEWPFLTYEDISWVASIDRVFEKNLVCPKSIIPSTKQLIHNEGNELMKI